MVVRNKTRDIVENDRGAVGVFVAGAMTILLGSAAIAVDMGHMMNVRTQSQAVADLAALAGASAFVTGTAGTPALTATIYNEAITFAGLNNVDGTPVTLLDADISIDLVNERVRVTVHHTVARGNPIPTIFARVFGINTVDVVTTAVAQAYPADGAKCILPFMLPDKYDENGGASPNHYDGPPDYYEPFIPSAPSGSATGYTEADKGTQIVIKPSQGNNPGKPNPSWYYPIAVYNTGGSAYSAAIAGCVDPDVTYRVGDLIPVEPGAMIGPTRQGVTALIAQAPSHYWNDTHNCVIDSNGAPNVCVSSPRLRPAPMLAPPDAPANGRRNVPIMNWAGLFVEGMQGNDVIVRFAGYSGFGVASTNPGGAGALPKVIRLVE